ncbi:MAG: glycosyltransferase family A protein [Geminicoccaceae bacterium]
MSAPVAVVIPCYRQAHLVAEAVRSSLDQDPPPAEVIVVDDGSPDDVAAAVASLGAQPTIRLLRRPNGGLSAARNTGLVAARSRFVVFLDADDRLLPGALRAGLECHDAHPGAAFVWGGFRNMDITGRPFGKANLRCSGRLPYRDLLLGNIIGMHGAVMYNRERLIAADGFDESLPSVEDWEIYLRLARNHQVACHRGIVAEYRRHSLGISANAERMIAGGLIGLERHRPQAHDPNSLALAWRVGRARFVTRYLRKATLAGLRGPDPRGSGSLRGLLRLVARQSPLLFRSATPDLVEAASGRRGIGAALASAEGPAWLEG